MTAIVTPTLITDGDLSDDHAAVLADGVHDFREFLLADERAFVGSDPRLRYTEHTVVRDGHVVGCLPVIDIPRVESLGSLFRSYLGLGGLSGAVRVVGGGLTIRRTSAFTCPCSDRSAVLRELLVKHLAESEPFAGSVVMPYLTEAEAAALQDGSSAVSDEDTAWSVLDLPAGTLDLDTYVAGLRRTTRNAWRNDRREAARLGLTFTEHPLDREWASIAAPLVSDVAANNGIVQPAMQLRWYLSGLRSRPGRPFVLATRRDGAVVATTICRELGAYLDIHQVGVASDLPDRRTVYQSATYLAPAQYAVRTGARRLGYAFGHVTPKRLRGCHTDDLVRLTLDADRT